MILTNYTLPEFTFLDAHAHLGNLLEGRTVIMHIRSCTVLEDVDLGEVQASNFTTPMYKYTYINSSGVEEHHMLAVHFSLAWEQGMPESEELKEIFKNTADWYCKYMAWEDKNIDEDNTTFKN